MSPVGPESRLSGFGACSRQAALQLPTPVAVFLPNLPRPETRHSKVPGIRLAGADCSVAAVERTLATIGLSARSV